MAGKPRRSSRRRSGPAKSVGRYTPPKDQADYARLPTSKLARLLLELFRQGPLLRADPAADNTVCFSWESASLGAVTVTVPGGDEQLLEVIESARSDSHHWVEFAALLTVLFQDDGVVGGFHADRVLELTLGKVPNPDPSPAAGSPATPRTPDRPHRERHRPHVWGQLRLLSAAHWHIKLSDAAFDGWTDGPLAHVADPDRDGHPRTVTLAGGVHPTLGEYSTLVPRRAFHLRGGTANREGNLPSRAVRARIRLAGAMAQRWRAKTGQRVRMQEIVETFAGIDSTRFSRRRRVLTLLRTGLDELTGQYHAGGAGLEAVPALARLERPLLHLLLSLAVPQVARSDPGAEDGQLARAGP